jgi:3-phenylpropionate/trans-cinnamate dioxygenase ferredoxin reductase component
VGLSSGYDACVVRGAPDARSLSVIYLNGGRVITLDCINAPKDYAQGRLLVTGGATPPLDQLADPCIAVKELATAALERSAR